MSEGDVLIEATFENISNPNTGISMIIPIGVSLVFILEIATFIIIKKKYLYNLC